MKPAAVEVVSFSFHFQHQDPCDVVLDNGMDFFSVFDGNDGTGSLIEDIVSCFFSNVLSVTSLTRFFEFGNYETKFVGKKSIEDPLPD